jgi:hypothetical protein
MKYKRERDARQLDPQTTRTISEDKSTRKPGLVFLSQNTTEYHRTPPNTTEHYRISTEHLKFY